MNQIVRLCLISGMLVSLLNGCSNTAVPSNSAATALPNSTQKGLPLQGKFDLGVIFQRDSVRMNRWIKNQSDHAVEVTQIEKSCECLEVKLSPTKIGPGERTLAQLHYDGTKEPDFMGSLLIEVKLNDDKGNNVGLVEVPIEVIRPIAAPKSGD